jgi:L-ascorbate metabolism protein UlaG (beta-lactamase superfamily)
MQNVKVVLLSHAHHDHLQDVPYILAQYPSPKERPLVVGSQSAHDLIMGYTRGVGIKWVDAIGGLQDSQTKILAFSPGKKSCVQKSGNISCEVGTFGNFIITAFASDHSSYDYLGSAVLGGTVHGKPPYMGTGYKMQSNTSVGYLIEYQGIRIFFTESPIVRHSNEIGNVDILIQGIAARRDYYTISGTLAALQPEYVIPGHYDNFFKPLKEFEKFDVNIGFGPVDFSRFEQFVTSFERYYVERARKRLTQNAHSFQPKLRLMKLFYYYSLVNLL